MKKLQLLFVLLVLTAILWGEFIWDEPVWLVPGHMLNDRKYLAAEAEDGFITLWVASDELQGHIMAAKYSWSGLELWGEEQISDSDLLPLLRDCALDSEGNIIVAYSVLDNNNPLRLLKTNPDGEFIWENDFVTISNEVYGEEIEIKRGTDEGFYALLVIDIGTSINYYYFYHFDSDGEISPGWENGIEIDGYRTWEIDNEGNILFVHSNDADELLLNGYTPSGELLFGEDILLEEDYENNPFWFFVELEILENGNYLCSIENKTWLIEPNGNILWEMDKLTDFELSSGKMIAGSECFYEISESGELFKFNYEPELEWSEIITDDVAKIKKLWVADNGNFRYLENDYEISQFDYNYQLMEYSAEGELLSPDTGWYNIENISNTYQAQWLAGPEDQTLWTSLSRDDSFNQELSFVIIDSEGELITGDEAVIVDTGLDKSLKAEAMYAGEESETVLMMDTGYIDEMYSWKRLIMQRLDLDGELLGSTTGELLITGDLEKICENENSVIYWRKDNSQIHLIDLETGDLPWGETGCDLDVLGEIIEVDAAFTADGVIIFWEDAEGFKIQRIVNGIGIWGNGVSLNLPDSPDDYVRIEGNFLINIIELETNDKYYISHFTDNGVIDWSVYGGYEVRISLGKTFLASEDGLIYLRQDVDEMYNGVSIQYLSNEGDFLYGEEGIPLEHGIWEWMNGFIELEDAFAFIKFDNSTEEPANFQSYSLDGSILQEETALSGTGFCRIVDVTIVEEGLIIMMTEECELFKNLKIGYYDFNGNLNSIAGDNPVVIYEDYAHYCSMANAMYDNKFYFCWQTMLNFEYCSMGSFGTEVLAQGWEIPIVSNDGSAIPGYKPGLLLSPNPFNPDVHISWSGIDNQKDCTLAIYNVKGQKIYQEKIIGQKCETMWNGRNANGKLVSSGIYLFEIKAEEEAITKKGLLLK